MHWWGWTIIGVGAAAFGALLIFVVLPLFALVWAGIQFLASLFRKP